METAIVSGMVGFALCAGMFGVLWIAKLRTPRKRSGIDAVSTIEKFRSVGELVAFKIITKEIITTSDHWFGEVGKKYFRWLASVKKMAMIFEFEIDFKFNLLDPNFVVEAMGNNAYRLKMPKCLYESRIKDISFYDEQGAKLLPWLLPELISKAIPNGFGEDTKNRLVAEAKNQASEMANELVARIRNEVQKSARQTLEFLARGFGARYIEVDFSDAIPVQAQVKYIRDGGSEGDKDKSHQEA